MFRDTLGISCRNYRVPWLFDEYLVARINSMIMKISFSKDRYLRTVSDPSFLLERLVTASNRPVGGNIASTMTNL